MADLDRVKRLWHRFPLPVRDRIWWARSGIARAYRRRRTVLAEALAPRVRRRVGTTETPEFALLCIYRTRNAHHAVALCRPAEQAGATIRLWDLDGGGHPDLAAWTVGTGLGDRPVLLNRLARELPEVFDGWIIIADDDIEIRSGDLEALVAITTAAGFDIAQPAHSARSHHSFPHTLARPLTVARRTEFVEVGPVVAIGPRARPHVFPIDEAHVMGLGAEFAWMDLRRLGIELGIVDCVTVEHLYPVGADYNTDPCELLDRMDAAGGTARFRTIHGVWYATRSRPPWAA